MTRPDFGMEVMPHPRAVAVTALDAAVLAACGFSGKKDLLAQLLALNLEVDARLARGETVTAPGVPPGHPDPARLVTDDCIRPQEPEGML